MQAGLINLGKVDITLVLHVLVQQVETRHVVHSNYADLKFFVKDDFLVELHEL